MKEHESMDHDDRSIENPGRRDFIKQTSAITTLALVPTSIVEAAQNKLDEKAAEYFETVDVSIEINGVLHQLQLEPRVTLLDLLRERLHLTGSKKGCDYGQCGACTVHVNGKRVLSCLTLAVMLNGKKVTTIEGIAKGDDLHPMQ